MSSPFHVYLDLDVRNDDMSTSSNPPPLSFEETRLQPFLKGDASDYFCTIARFTLQTSNSIPVFIPEIEGIAKDSSGNNVTDSSGNFIYNTVYKIGWKNTNGTTIGPFNIPYVPADLTASPPASLNSNTDPSNTYFHVHSYQRFIDMINKTLQVLFAQKPTLPNNNTAPYMEWDSTAFTATLYADAFYFDTIGNPGDGKWQIYFNTRLYQLFNTFPATHVSLSGDFNYRLDLSATPTNTVQSKDKLSGSTITLISLPQEISTISDMSPLDSIVFTTTSIPILPQQSTLPKVITSSNQVVSGNGLPNITNVLTDFQIALSASNHYKPEISYAPPGEYRLIDMYSNSDLRRIDLQVFWKDKKGVFHPLLLYPGCAASVKFLFRHKHFYLGQ